LTFDRARRLIAKNTLESGPGEITLMKASAFSYARATSVVNALELLAAHGDDAKVLSGGQSLMPAMNLRLISPQLIVDIGGITELKGIALEGEVLTIGALTRHVDLQRSPDIARHAPLLAEAIAHVAHPAIRNKGTIGGSLAHADPASELPACMVALDATIAIRGPAGERRVAARDFFTGIYETALSADELLTAVELPVARENSAHFFCEFARRHGDYAIVGAAAQAIVEGGLLADLRLVFFAVGDRPHLARAASKLINVTITPEIVADASTALADELDPPEDQQATSSMRRHLAKVLLARCVAALLGRPIPAAGARV
jgi:carbon-monoxide dehydrogenase medium subunit